MAKEEELGVLKETLQKFVNQVEEQLAHLAPNPATSICLDSGQYDQDLESNDPYLREREDHRVIYFPVEHPLGELLADLQSKLYDTLTNAHNPDLDAIEELCKLDGIAERPGSMQGGEVETRVLYTHVGSILWW